MPPPPGQNTTPDPGFFRVKILGYIFNLRYIILMKNIPNCAQGDPKFVYLFSNSSPPP